MQISASINAVTGVCGDGLRTTVFPAASAGASFHDAAAIGKLKGTMQAQTPTGSFRMMLRLGTGTSSACSSSSASCARSSA